jgi:hypothetical protein
MLGTDGILMTSVHTGWITDESPHPTNLLSVRSRQGSRSNDKPARDFTPFPTPVEAGPPLRYIGEDLFRASLSHR